MTPLYSRAARRRVQRVVVCAVAFGLASGVAVAAEAQTRRGSSDVPAMVQVSHATAVVQSDAASPAPKSTFARWAVTATITDSAVKSASRSALKAPASVQTASAKPSSVTPAQAKAAAHARTVAHARAVARAKAAAHARAVAREKAAAHARAVAREKAAAHARAVAREKAARGRSHASGDVTLTAAARSSESYRRSVSESAWRNSPNAHKIVWRESNGRCDVVDPSRRWFGEWQMSSTLWKGFGGSAYAPSPQDASCGEQDRVAYRVWVAAGWSPWNV